MLRESQKLQSENQLLRKQGQPDLLAESRAMQPVLTMMERIGPSDANVLIVITSYSIHYTKLYAPSKTACRCATTPRLM